MFDSELPLWWWKVEWLHDTFIRLSCWHRFINASLLRSDELSEQFESVPISKVSCSSLFSTAKFTRSVIHSKYSSSFPLVGKYTDINKNLWFWVLSLTPVNPALVVLRLDMLGKGWDLHATWWPRHARHDHYCQVCLLVGQTCQGLRFGCCSLDIFYQLQSPDCKVPRFPVGILALVVLMCVEFVIGRKNSCKILLY